MLSSSWYVCPFLEPEAVCLPGRFSAFFVGVWPAIHLRFFLLAVLNTTSSLCDSCYCIVMGSYYMSAMSCDETVATTGSIA